MFYYLMKSSRLGVELAVEIGWQLLKRGIITEIVREAEKIRQDLLVSKEMFVTYGDELKETFQEEMNRELPGVITSMVDDETMAEDVKAELKKAGLLRR